VRLSDLEGWPLLPTLGGERLAYVAHRALLVALPPECLHLSKPCTDRWRQQRQQEQQAGVDQEEVEEEDPWASLTAVPKGHSQPQRQPQPQPPQQLQQRHQQHHSPDLLVPWSAEAPQLADLVRPQHMLLPLQQAGMLMLLPMTLATRCNGI